MYKISFQGNNILGEVVLELLLEGGGEKVRGGGVVEVVVREVMEEEGLLVKGGAGVGELKGGFIAFYGYLVLIF